MTAGGRAAGQKTHPVRAGSASTTASPSRPGAAQPPPAAVRAIVGVNLAWAVASVLLVTVGGLVLPTALGTGLVVLQAVPVLVFAETQWVGLRRATR